MEKILDRIIEWIEYFKKRDDLIEKRLLNIEDYLASSTEERIQELMDRLDKLEEVIEEPLEEESDDEPTDSDSDGDIE